MTTRPVTLDLPPEIYDQLQQRAQYHQRRIEDEAALTLATALHDLPGDVESITAALNTLDDETLWKLSNSQPAVEDGILLQALVDKRRRQGLAPGEERWLTQLIQRRDQVMLLRAEAIALLHRRGVDVQERVSRA